MALKRSEQTDQFFRSLLSLQSIDECYQYFEDVCTVKEVMTIAQRLEVARMLSGGMSYQQTIAQTGASSATISRVKRCLDYGDGGYALILSRLAESEETT